METSPVIVRSFSGHKFLLLFSPPPQKKAVVPRFTLTCTFHFNTVMQLGMQLSGTAPKTQAEHRSLLEKLQGPVSLSQIYLPIAEHRRGPVSVLRECRAHWVDKARSRRTSSCGQH